MALCLDLSGCRLEEAANGMWLALPDFNARLVCDPNYERSVEDPNISEAEVARVSPLPFPCPPPLTLLVCLLVGRVPSLSQRCRGLSHRQLPPRGSLCNAGTT